MFQTDTKEDTIMIWNLGESKGYGARRLIREFSDKNWKRRGIKNCQERCTKVVYLTDHLADHTHPAAVWCSLEHWWHSWPMPSTLASLCLSQRRTFWTLHCDYQFVFLVYLMNFTFHVMLDASGIVLRVHYKSMKCDVLFSQGSVRTIFRWGGHFFIHELKHFFLFTTVQKL